MRKAQDGTPGPGGGQTRAAANWPPPERGTTFAPGSAAGGTEEVRRGYGSGREQPVPPRVVQRHLPERVRGDHPDRPRARRGRRVLVLQPDLHAAQRGGPGAGQRRAALRRGLGAAQRGRAPGRGARQRRGGAARRSRAPGWAALRRRPRGGDSLGEPVAAGDRSGPGRAGGFRPRPILPSRRGRTGEARGRVRLGGGERTDGAAARRPGQDVLLGIGAADLLRRHDHDGRGRLVARDP